MMSLEHTSPEKHIHQAAKKEVIEFHSPVEVKIEILKMFDIHLTPSDFDNHDEIHDTAIRDKLYNALLLGLRDGKSANLEFIIRDGLLSQKDLRERGLSELKKLAIDILLNSKHQKQAQEKQLFIEAGILSEEEIMKARDAHYSIEQ